jgi:hypothetical protein
MSQSGPAVVHLPDPIDIVAGELPGPLTEEVAADERHQPLQRRLEIGAPPDDQVVTLARQWHEAEIELSRDRRDAEPGISAALADRERHFSLGAQGRAVGVHRLRR